MSTIKSFEEIEAWRKARELSKRIYKLTKEGDFARDYRFRDQINSSSVSIMDNIAEGFERNGNKEFVQFLSIAKGSTGELRSQLYRAYDGNYIEQNEFEDLKTEAITVSKLISSLLGYLKSSEYKGSKFSSSKP